MLRKDEGTVEIVLSGFITLLVVILVVFLINTKMFYVSKNTVEDNLALSNISALYGKDVILGEGAESTVVGDAEIIYAMFTDLLKKNLGLNSDFTSNGSGVIKPGTIVQIVDYCVISPSLDTPLNHYINNESSVISYDKTNKSFKDAKGNSYEIKNLSAYVRVKVVFELGFGVEKEVYFDHIDGLGYKNK